MTLWTALFAGAAYAAPEADRALSARVIDALAGRFPGCSAEELDPVTLSFTCEAHVLRLDLGRTRTECEGGESACAARLASLLDTVALALAPAPAITLDQILPEVRSNAWVEALPPELRRELVLQPLVGDLVVVWVVDTPQASRAIQARELSALGLQPAELLQRTLPHLRAELEKGWAKDAPGLHLVSGDAYMSSVLLDPAWLDGARAGGTVYVVAAATDAILYTESEKRADWRQMRLAAEDIAKVATIPLSTTVYAWDGESWSVAR